MRLQEKARIVMMTLALVIAEAVVAEQYDFEAIAKAIEGCETLENFRGGVARVTMNGERFYIDLQGRRVEKLKEATDPTALICDYKGGKFGYKDQKGNVVIPHKFHYAHDFSDGMAIVVNKAGKVGFINTKGELAIPYQYGTMSESDGNDFHEGLCAVVVDDEHEWFSYIDKTGRRLFKVNNEAIYTGDDIRYSEGLSVVYGKGKYEKKRGFMDKTGRITFCLGKDE